MMRVSVLVLIKQCIYRWGFDSFRCVIYPFKLEENV